MASEPLAKPGAPPAGEPDSPEVAALRKKVRGETLTDAELSALEAAYRKPAWAGTGIPHEQIMAELDERRRLGK